MIPDFRKLLVDGKQWKVHMELTFEQLPEIFPYRFKICQIGKRVDADGSPAVIPEGYKVAYRMYVWNPYLTKVYGQQSIK